MTQANILLIGALKDAASSLTKIAKEQDVNTIQATDIEMAIKVLCEKKIDMVFLDVNSELPSYFTKLNENKINVPTVVTGPSQPVQNAVKAIRLGAIEYLSTPLEGDLAQTLIERVKPSKTTKGPVHGDPATISLLDLSKKFASSNATILLRGESGTGKEVFSNFIHNNSPRKDKPFVSLNCAAIPETLIESELFGHEKGAFSGAINSRMGKFQQADGGTLLLDEISEMDVLLQAKLLRAIQERVIDPVGSTKSVPVDIRLIATTNRNLEEEVAKGNFREDLYFRLNVVMLDIPSLRDRPGDIIPLAEYFAKIYGEQNGLTNITINDESQQKLISCYWKGNVRELENTVHRAVLMMGDDNIMCPEHITISPMSQNMASTINQAPVPTDDSKKRALSSAAAGAYANASGGFEKGIGGTEPSAADMVGRTVQEMEQELILSTLNYCKGNRTHAAGILGISIRTLRNKLKEYNDKTNSEQAATA
tara:strand:+ start:105678 stop:107120 length:1443 start_codon:yes stop_codon:yes gene_type:complete